MKINPNQYDLGIFNNHSHLAIILGLQQIWIAQYNINNVICKMAFEQTHPWVVPLGMSHPKTFRFIQLQSS
jgi:hypothetical protein